MKTKLVTILLFAAGILSAQKNNLNIMFYNVENLFDTINDPKTKDEDFLPTAETKWDTKKYFNKLNNIASVIDSVIPGKGFPDLVGMVEVENKTAIEDLINKTKLKSGNFAVAHIDSKDERGIDVGLIYNKGLLTLLESKSIDVSNAPGFDPYHTRDILYCKFQLGKNEILNVFINHWPSRREGDKVSEPKRIFAAQKLKEACDELLKKDPKAKIVILGDLNDHPDNTSVNVTLGAKEDLKVKGTVLVDLMASLDKQKKGTHFFDNEWRCLDHIIVSKGLLESKKGLKCNLNSGQIFDSNLVMFVNNKTGEKKPNRTFGGNNKYFNGYSDHLPVYMMLKY